MASKVKAGEAYVSLTADSAGLQKGVQKSKAALESLGKSAKKLDGITIGGSIVRGARQMKDALKEASVGLANIGGRITKVGNRFGILGAKVVAGAMAAGAGVAYVTRSFVTLGDQLDKMSARLGASVEWLSAMTFAADRSGASIEYVENASKKLSKAIAEANKGTGVGLEAFKALGIDLKKLTAMGVEEQFEAVAKALHSVSDQALKTKLTMALWEEEGTKLLPMLGDLDELKAKAEELGIVMKGAQAKTAAELLDAWTNVKYQLSAIWVSLGEAIAPALKQIAGWMSKVVGPIQEFVSKNKETFVALAKTIAMLIAVGGALIAVKVALMPLTFAFSGLGSIIGILAPLIGAMVSTCGGFGKALMLLTTGTTNAGKALAFLKDKFETTQIVGMLAFDALKKGLVTKIAVIRKMFFGMAKSIAKSAATLTNTKISFGKHTLSGKLFDPFQIGLAIVGNLNSGLLRMYDLLLKSPKAAQHLVDSIVGLPGKFLGGVKGLYGATVGNISKIFGAISRFGSKVVWILKAPIRVAKDFWDGMKVGIDMLKITLGAFKGVFTFFKMNFAAIGLAGKIAFGAIPILVVAAIGAIVYLAYKFDWLGKVAEGLVYVWDSVANGLKAAWDTVTSAINAGIQWLGDMWDWICDGFQNKWTETVDMVTGLTPVLVEGLMLGNVKAAWDLALDSLQYSWLNWTSGIMDTWDALVSNWKIGGVYMSTYLLQAWAKVGKGFEVSIVAVKHVFTGAWDYIVWAAKRAFYGVYAFIADTFDDLVAVVRKGILKAKTYIPGNGYTDYNYMQDSDAIDQEVRNSKEQRSGYAKEVDEELEAGKKARAKEWAEAGTSWDRDYDAYGQSRKEQLDDIDKEFNRSVEARHDRISKLKESIDKQTKALKDQNDEEQKKLEEKAPEKPRSPEIEIPQLDDVKDIRDNTSQIAVNTSKEATSAFNADAIGIQWSPLTRFLDQLKRINLRMLRGDTLDALHRLYLKHGNAGFSQQSLLRTDMDALEGYVQAVYRRMYDRDGLPRDFGQPGLPQERRESIRRGAREVSRVERQRPAESGNLDRVKKSLDKLNGKLDQLTSNVGRYASGIDSLVRVS